jgi:hypothetical protein
MRMAIRSAFAALALASLAACAGNSSTDAQERPSDVDSKSVPSSAADAPSGGDSSPVGKYDQTWPKDYSHTTCREWLNKMSQHENFVAAADMLVGARSVDDKDAGLPSDELVDEFRDGVTTACVEPAMKLTDVAAALYLTEKARFKP